MTFDITSQTVSHKSVHKGGWTRHVWPYCNFLVGGKREKWMKEDMEGRREERVEFERRGEEIKR